MAKFPKSERLHLKKQIDRLFLEGVPHYTYPLRCMVIQEAGQASEVKALFSVSKRNFKRAVDRNKLKRRMREAFRGHKDLSLKGNIFHLSQKNSEAIHIGFIYTSKKLESFASIEKAMHKIFGQISNNQTTQPF